MRHPIFPGNILKPQPTPLVFFGQNGEDYLLWCLFRGKQSGFFVDIGAFDGIHKSNSYLFETLGWQGLCVEAHPDYFPICKKNRPNSVSVQCACVGAVEDTASVTFFAEDLGLYSGLKKGMRSEIREQYAARGMQFSDYEIANVSVSTLNEVIKSHAPNQSSIDFILVSTNGTELGILEDFNFEKFRTRCFVVHASDEKNMSNLVQLMRAKAYVLARILGNSLFFCANQRDLIFLKYTRVFCEIADTLHPKGEQATLPAFRKRQIADRERWITPNVLCQQPDQPLNTVIDYIEQAEIIPGKSPRLKHVINLFDRPGDDSHHAVQGKTIQSMLDAKNFTGDDQVSHVSVHVAEDAPIVPESFQSAEELERTVADVANFRRQRKLPLLFDVLDKGAKLAGPDDYIIYTNNDICLKPYFYKVILELIGAGFDAITINRRTIGELQTYLQYPELASSETGSSHPGFDCLVFKCSDYRKFIRNNACIGAGWVMRGLLYNMVAYSKRMLMLKNVDLTYHFGDDQAWQDDVYSDYTQFNEKEYLNTLQQLCAADREGQRLRQFCQRHGERFVPP